MKPTEKQIQEFKNSIERINPLTRECWFDLKPLIYIKEISENDYFSKEGQYPKDLGFIVSGILRIFYLSDKGEEWNKHFLLKNDFVASSISLKKKSITNIQALSSTTIICIPISELIELSKKHSQINSFIQEIALSYLEQKQEREISLLSNEAMYNYLSFKETYPDLEDKIKHYHIASYLGITPTQLSRLRKKLNSHQHM